MNIVLNMYHDVLTEINNGDIDPAEDLMVGILTTSYHEPKASHSVESDLNGEVNPSCYTRPKIVGRKSLSKVECLVFEPFNFEAKRDFTAAHFHILNLTRDRLMAWGMLYDPEATDGYHFQEGQVITLDFNDYSNDIAFLKKQNQELKHALIGARHFVRQAYENSKAVHQTPGDLYKDSGLRKAIQQTKSLLDWIDRLVGENGGVRGGKE